MSKVTKKKIKLKKPYIIVLRVILIVLLIIGLILGFYKYQIDSLKKLGYSYKASKNILFKFKKDYVIKIGKNKSLNKAFESSNYIDKNIDVYKDVKYVNHKDYIDNINKLVKKKYTTNDINLIISHGSNEDVKEFLKRDRVRYIEEFFSYDFAKLKKYDRYVKYSLESGEDEETTIIYVNIGKDHEYYSNTIEEKNYNELMLVNKYRYLSKDYEPKLVSFEKKYTNDVEVKALKEVVESFNKMARDASDNNLELIVNSAYRSYDDQVEIEDEYRKAYGDDYVFKYVAKPGHSEHQTGLALDIGSKRVLTFANSKEYLWMLENAHKYGFILRYQKKYEDLTGFRSEAWHFRYVGEKIAADIYEKDMSYEEYYVRYLDNN